MDEEKVELIKFIVEMLSKYGIPLVINMIQDLQYKNEITVDDINDLRNKIMDPDVYLNKIDEQLKLNLEG